MIASLMMYARPELDAAHVRYWALIRDELARRGIPAPETLSNGLSEFDVWTSRDLVLSQTCGMPYRKRLHDQVSLIGTPDFGVDGCPPGYYRSPIVVRADDPRTALSDFAQARFAYNMNISQSGFASIYAATRPHGFWFRDRTESGSHSASAQAVAAGTADIAALDAVTWRLIQRYDDFAPDLRVLEWTDPTPGLPYIAAAGADTDATFDAVHAAIGSLDAPDRKALGIKDLIAIPKETYLAIPNPPDSAG
ncbi:phosphate/phosphite/phosphonate ABC transporter substrate-binding protein [Sulfitobacter aestuariivivens]|uniref:PhnD/SsuA/transferrin family substrate-binding protein n=1 Tax=Sulfitobacter aestuariivivens TaxID=2766981 RepID=A0A927D8N1_9RHOB|nr:PhnD/SsuA/transferrin family substrate-binding protein [Sulfitobacter aestuariivivens]MBD3664786.1 PhnD/SsuA/transferrin family substrate-binding protein [Sulfitobacter aestuariivivens]